MAASLIGLLFQIAGNGFGCAALPRGSWVAAAVLASVPRPGASTEALVRLPRAA